MFGGGAIAEIAKFKGLFSFQDRPVNPRAALELGALVAMPYISLTWDEANRECDMFGSFEALYGVGKRGGNEVLEEERGA